MKMKVEGAQEQTKTTDKASVTGRGLLKRNLVRNRNISTENNY